MAGQNRLPLLGQSWERPYIISLPFALPLPFSLQTSSLEDSLSHGGLYDSTTYRCELLHEATVI